MPFLAQHHLSQTACSFACALALFVGGACEDGSTRPNGTVPVVVTVDTLAKFQTMTGWEATSQSGHLDPQFPAFRNSLFDQAVNDLGINRIRLEIRAGAENPVDNAPSGDTPDRCKRWLTINDNDDPSTINPAGFHFSAVDSAVTRVVLPMKQRLEARGERLFVNLNYVAFLRQCPPPVYVHAEPAEYAEFILAAFIHLRARFGLVPDAVEVILEPDNVPVWSSGTVIGRMIVATGERLLAAGFKPVFIAPSTANLERGLAYLEDLYRVPGVEPFLRELAYHRYAGVSDENLAAFARRAKAAGAGTAMLEHIGSDVEDLYSDLTVAHVSAWQQYTLAFPTIDNGAQYFRIVDGRPVVASRTRYLRQYFHYVRMGAQRLGAVSDASGIRAVAFQNADGRLVVVLHAESSRPVEIRGLRPGNYGVSATTSSLTWAELGDSVVGPAGTLTFTAPSAGVMTVYGKE